MAFDTLTLSYYATFGKGDSSDTFDWDVDLDAEQAAAYEKAVMTRTTLDDVPELQHLVDDAYADIVEHETRNMLECGDEYTYECTGEGEVDAEYLNELVADGDEYAIEFFGLQDLSEEERQAWDANDLEKLPLVKDFDEDFEPCSPFDAGWGISVYPPEVDEIELEEDEVCDYLRRLFASGDIETAEKVVETQAEYFDDLPEEAYELAEAVGCQAYIEKHKDVSGDTDNVEFTKSLTFEVCISVSRPSYSTESYYSADLSDEDYEAIENSSSWEEIPREIYDRVYDCIIDEIEAELRYDGTLDDDEEVTDRFDIYIAHPNED